MRRRLHRVGSAWSVPTLCLRGIVLAILVLSAWSSTVAPPMTWLAAGAAVAGAVMPRSLGSWGALAAIIVAYLFEPQDPVRTAVLLLLISVVHALATLLITVPWRARVTLRALLPTLRRVLLVQAIAQPVALVIGLVPVVRDTGGIPIAAVLAVVSAAVLAGLLYRLLRPSGANVRGPA